MVETTQDFMCAKLARTGYNLQGLQDGWSERGSCLSVSTLPDDKGRQQWRMAFMDGVLPRGGHIESEGKSWSVHPAGQRPGILNTSAGSAGKSSNDLSPAAQALRHQRNRVAGQPRAPWSTGVSLRLSGYPHRVPKAVPV